MRKDKALLDALGKGTARTSKPPRRRFPGIYRAICADNCDPEGLRRIRIRHPMIWGEGENNLSPWAWPKNAVGAGGAYHVNADGTIEITGDMGSTLGPVKGSPVWVEFEENGNPDFPVYSSGWWFGSGGGSTKDATVKPSQMPLEARLKCPQQYTCFGDVPRTCIGCPDLVDHGATDSYDDIEHRPFHDHRAGEAQCPRLQAVYKTETGHTLLTNDKQGREFTALIDRSGQCFTMNCRILPELQVGVWADGSMKDNALQRGMRIMSRHTEGIVSEAADGPAEFPTVAAQAVLDSEQITQADVATAIDGLAGVAARAVLDGTPLGNVLGLLDGVTVGGVPLTPGGVFRAFAGGAAKTARDAVTAAMNAVGTSPQALLSAAMATFGIPGILGALPAPISAVLSAVGSVASVLSGVFPTVLAPAIVGNDLDGFDPRIYCVDQHASVGFRDLARGFVRLETAAVIDQVEVEGPSAGAKTGEAAVLGALGMTQAALGEAMGALSLPAVKAALQGTGLGNALNAISSLSLGGVPLTPAAVFSALTGGATAAARKAVSDLLGTVGLSPMKLLDSLKTFQVTPALLTALRGIPGIGSLTSLVPGSIGLGALGSVLTAIPGASLLGAPLAALGALGIFGLWGFFPSAGTEIGEKAIIARSDRDKTRFQFAIIDHATGSEKILISGLKLNGIQLGPQLVIDSSQGGRSGFIDPTTGSYELLEQLTGGTKEGLYLGGRVISTGGSDLLTVLGSWLCFVGVPPLLMPKDPIDPLPVLDEKAILGNLAPGAGLAGGDGSMLHFAMLNATRVAGVNIWDAATVNYTRTVGAVDTVEVGAAQFVTVGASQWVDVASTQNILVGLDRTVKVGGLESIWVGGMRSVLVGANLSHEVGGVYSLLVGLYATQYCGGEHQIKAGMKVKLMGGALPFEPIPTLPIGVVIDAAAAALVGIIASETVEATA